MSTYGVGMTVTYRSGDLVGQTGVILDTRRTRRGTPEYLVRFDDGREVWLLARNVQF